MLRATAAEFEWEEMEDAFEIPWSMNRDRMAKDIEYLQLTCPGQVEQHSVFSLLLYLMTTNCKQLQIPHFIYFLL